ncbi:hypothetical protein [Nonomuraea longispora]|nr:hypothetical protein [Nonomuraea longispora]
MAPPSITWSWPTTNDDSGDDNHSAAVARPAGAGARVRDMLDGR